MSRVWKTMTCVALVLASCSVLLTAVLFTQSANTTSALCVLRADLQTRIDTSTAYLEQHPEGIPGVDPKVIRAGITNQRRTVAALRSLDCH